MSFQQLQLFYLIIYYYYCNIILIQGNLSREHVTEVYNKACSQLWCNLTATAS